MLTERRAVCVIGLPGSGKTTLAAALAERTGGAIFSVGSLLRKVDALDSEAALLMIAGKPVPLSTFSKMLLTHLDEHTGLTIVDGSPRTLEQLTCIEQHTRFCVTVIADVTLRDAERRLRARARRSSRIDDNDRSILERLRRQSMDLEAMRRALYTHPHVVIDGTVAADDAVSALLQSPSLKQLFDT